ncbi:unnamed protein product [Colias eurytheme]|nr:unnamed protein product [Colias eurytheme]
MFYHLNEYTCGALYTAVVKGQDDSDLDTFTPRPMPDFGPDIKINKTSFEEDMEECMAEFTQCFIADRKKQICALNDRQEKKTFLSLCLMEYENCKNTGVTWRYYIDGAC